MTLIFEYFSQSSQTIWEQLVGENLTLIQILFLHFNIAFFILITFESIIFGGFLTFWENQESKMVDPRWLLG